MINKKLVKAHFSRSAWHYDQYTKVQKKMAQELINNLKKDSFFPGPDCRILDLGCGTGFLTRQLRDLFPQAQITAVDLAPGMLAVARQKLADPRIEFLCGDVEEMVFSEKYDLIISNATFQWFNNLAATLQKLTSNLKPEGSFFFATFGAETFRELHQAFHRAKAELNLNLEENLLPGQKFYGLSDLIRICQQVFQSSLTDSLTIHGHELLEYEYFATVNDFFQSIKKIGAHNSNQQRHHHLTLTKRMIANYQELSQKSGGVRATYHCLYISIKP